MGLGADIHVIVITRRLCCGGIGGEGSMRFRLKRDGVTHTSKLFKRHLRQSARTHLSQVSIIGIPIIGKNRKGDANPLRTCFCVIFVTKIAIRVQREHQGTVGAFEIINCRLFRHTKGVVGSGTEDGTRWDWLLRRGHTDVLAALRVVIDETLIGLGAGRAAVVVIVALVLEDAGTGKGLMPPAPTGWR